jgi:hypothetical protein
MADQENEMEKIECRLKSLENRLAILESAFTRSENTKFYKEEEEVPSSFSVAASGTMKEEEKGLESRIGRFGLAWLGNIVLLVGISFLIQYLMILGFRYLSILVGYSAAVSLFYIANYLKNTNRHLASMLKMNAHILLFYVTVRLHYFSSSPVISNEIIACLLMVSLITFQTYLSIRNKSQLSGALSVLFTLAAAIISDTSQFMLILISVSAVGSTYYYFRFRWKPLVMISIFLAYISFFLWIFGNPFMGHPMQMITELYHGVIYLFGLGACFSIILLFRDKDGSSDDYLIGVTFANGILFTLMLLLVVLRFFHTDYVLLFGVIAICCLLFSTLLHSESDWNFGSAYYALYGFMTMSIALYGLVGFPWVYFLLSIQSLIVVSMALWFRNRLIAVLNSFLFLTILAIYLLSSKAVNEVNFSFALISLISARIINWKKSRLHIKTDLLRNLYLTEGFFMVLYALFHAMPGQFITLSWTMAALLYFLLSFILKNVKYRYMALGTMICAAFYLFLVDLARIEIIYRVLALLFLAVISIGISIYYTNRTKKIDS